MLIRKFKKRLLSFQKLRKLPDLIESKGSVGAGRVAGLNGVRCLVVCAVLVFGGFGKSGRDGERSSVNKISKDRISFLQVGEELEYKVSYSFFNIGTLHFKILDRKERNGRTIVKSRLVIESNPSLSWLTEVHIQFYGEMDDSIFSYYWISEDSSKKGIDYHSLTFDYDESRLFFQKGTILSSGERKNSQVDTINIKSRGQDGLSLYFYARENARQRKQVSVPIFIDNKESKANINFQNRIEDVEIGAVDYPIETVFIDGKADFVGVVGLTGGFRGWFSNDDARIPILARLNVWLGSIKVELKSWRRADWRPPRYVERN
jgi:hypothetical protein